MSENLTGILLCDKPSGLSSNAVLQRIKRLYGAKKAGHAGSLDPLASGMLPIYFGEATKFAQYLLNADKHYIVHAKLGLSTTTGDREGEVVSEGVTDGITTRIVEKTLSHFRGAIEQVPSMYSALKHQGQPLYCLARKGIEVERKPRPIVIYDLQLLDYSDDRLILYVHCSKGTYIRSLVEDIGDDLACGAHVQLLRRVKVGDYHAHQMQPFDTLLAQADDPEQLHAHLLSIDSSLPHWPEVTLPAQAVLPLQQGQVVVVPQARAAEQVRLKGPYGEFLGIGEVLPEGRVRPKRLLQTVVITSAIGQT